MHGELRAIRTWVFTDVHKSYYYNWYLTIYLVMSNVLMNTPWIFLELSRNIKFNVTGIDGLFELTVDNHDILPHNIVGINPDNQSILSYTSIIYII